MQPTIDSNRSAFIYPDGRKPGCLPRASRPGEVCPLAAERIKIIPRQEWADYAADISLRPHVKTVLNQGSVGSCAFESPCGGTMIARSIQGLEHVVLNPYFGYHTTSGGRDQGSSIDDNLAFMRQYGCASEAVWPRSKGWRTKPSEEAWADALYYRIEEFYDVTSIDEMVSCLLYGFPVIYGSNGHAVCKVQHIDDSKGLDLNSWGSDWGDGGFGVWASYRAVNWGYGAFAIRVANQVS